MFSRKRWGIYGVGAAVAVLVIYWVGDSLGISILTGYWYAYTAGIIIAYAGLCLRRFYRHKRSQWEMYPKLKKRALEAAGEKDGIITFQDLGKVPSTWHDWLMGKFEEEGIATIDPRGGEKILFPEIIAETRTPDEIMELGLPTDIGADIMEMAEEKQESEG